jgi:hypothetical protein
MNGFIQFTVARILRSRFRPGARHTQIHRVAADLLADNGKLGRRF